MHKYLLLVLTATAALLWTSGDCKSTFGIGTRIFGDQLLLKDVQESRPAATSEQPTISFNYAIPEPITYIEILSDENIYAEVDFGYHDNLVTGIVRALKKHDEQNDTATTETAFALATMDAEAEADETEIEEAAADASLTLTNQTTHAAHSFEIHITIYGFNDTILNVSPAYILNRDQQIEGVLKPFRDNHNVVVDAHTDAADDDDNDGPIDESDYVNAYVNKRMANYELEDGEKRPSSATEDNDSEDADADDADGEQEHAEAASGNDYATNGNDFEQRDKIIEIGRRQNGDFLIYETYQTSAQATAEGSNHTVVFYYIDSDFITYVKFVIFDHFAEKSSTDANYIAPVGEYSHYSPNTMKATITEYETTSLFVQMFIYGYRANAVPKSYEAFLLPPNWRRNSAFGSNKMPLTVMQRLEKCLKGGAVQGPTATTTPLLRDEADDDGNDDASDDASDDDNGDTDANTLTNLPAADLQLERILLAKTMLHAEEDAADAADAANALTQCMWTAILSLALLFHS